MIQFLIISNYSVVKWMKNQIIKKEVKQKRKRKSVEKWERGICFRFSGLSVVLFVRSLAGWLAGWYSMVCVVVLFRIEPESLEKINNLRWNEKVTWFFIELCGWWGCWLRVGNLYMLVEREIANGMERDGKKGEILETVWNGEYCCIVTFDKERLFGCVLNVFCVKQGW